ncbi:hypothetical protein LTR16_012769, partial [Cryomyces antarcticus]
YIPGMHLRVSEEAEMMGLDLDQFFDEQIGDWSVFEPTQMHGLPQVARGSEQSIEGAEPQVELKS